MLVSQIIESSFPFLSLNDKVSSALKIMEDYDILHLPVVAEEKFVGIIEKDDLLDADPDTLLATLQTHFINSSVLSDEHFVSALKIANRFELTLVPAVSKTGELLGVVTQKELIRTLAVFLNVEEPGGLIVLEMEAKDYSFNAISRIIESNDAQIKQLNTTTDPQNGLIQVTIKVDKPEISDIVATFQRYEYNVKYYFGEELYENELKSNYDNLMNYLKI